MLQDLLIPFISILALELGDKTQLAIICLSSKTKRRIALFLGVMAGFIIADGLGIAFGSLLTTLIPKERILLIGGIIFLIFGAFMLYPKEEGKESCDLRSPFFSGFTVILAAEMGDKTQVTAIIFAAKYNIFLVFLGVIAALAILSYLAIILGDLIKRKIERRKVSKIAGIVFILIGILTLTGWI